MKQGKHLSLCEYAEPVEILRGTRQHVEKEIHRKLGYRYLRQASSYRQLIQLKPNISKRGEAQTYET